MGAFQTQHWRGFEVTKIPPEKRHAQNLKVQNILQGHSVRELQQNDDDLCQKI